jgi:hypothetical protein
MPGRLIKEIKLKNIPAAIVTFATAVLAALAGLLFIRSVDRVSPPLSQLPTLETTEVVQPVDTRPKQTAISSSEAPQKATPSTLLPATLAQSNPAKPKSDEKLNTNHQGILRVSNPTEHPVRIALLFKKPAPPTVTSTTYEPPAHWDFEPGEGSNKGLILSLPNRRIQLKKGDVLVAFAQDGSRRYWGPYVIGETSEPNWTAKTTEWQLTLVP